MDRHARISALLAMLAENGKVEVDEAVAALGASPATIRRDLVYLDEQRLATRTHGGAVADSGSFDLPLHFKTGRAMDEKRRIGQVAAGLAPIGSTTGLNGGTTTLAVARALAARPDLAARESGAPALTIVTNAVNVAGELLVRPYLKVVVTGGVVRAHSYELFGPLAERSLEALSVDLLFLGVDGIDAGFGASAYSDAEASTNLLMVKAAARIVVVADSSKIGRRAFAQICPPAGIDTLVTDKGIEPAAAAQLRGAGVEVIAA
ncbi:MAG: DeoR/GlpR family DNA-binding transcription regulator [Bifidobacteriaceae bacterium]|jgi:DeoR family transcriptional regulator of aga operon|nr:DeoR/GlpR family DNA-binding transcription regulator [Bifidobacteriaceae bacterium]